MRDYLGLAHANPPSCSHLRVHADMRMWRPEPSLTRAIQLVKLMFMFEPVEHDDSMTRPNDRPEPKSYDVLP